MSHKAQGAITILVGVLVLAFSLLADVVGIGARPGVMGWKQVTGAAVGLAICLVGVVVMLRHAGTPGQG